MGDEQPSLTGLNIRKRAREAARRMWMKYALRGVRQNDAHERLDLAYKISDPWHMDAAREQFRFAETNRIIQAKLLTTEKPRLDRFDRVLEIGCGEGHQTEHLVRLADKMTGLDVSANAIARARRRVPEASFEVGDLFAQSWATERGRFDLVTACEVLYYMSDIPKFLKTIDELGGTCFVTYFGPAGRLCDGPVKKMPNVEQTRFNFEDTEWVAAWWTGASRRR